jgi:hypothetical protein
VLILAGSALYVVRNWSGDGPAPAPLIVTIAEGATLRRAATTLEEQGAIRSAENFLQLARCWDPAIRSRRASMKFPHGPAHPTF